MSRVHSVGFRFAGVVLLVVLPALVGCGKRTGVVTGKVTYQNQPLTSGAVIFHGTDGRVDSGAIDSEGRYTIPQAPIGPARVTVQVGQSGPVPRVSGPGRTAAAKHPGDAKAGTHPSKAGAPQGKPLVIPPKYQDPTQSGLTWTVTGGNQTYDIKLE